jgi:tRNA U34 5-methylaminomethyl-2-thiouridine-forming methyltransferase MnmC
MKVDLKTTKDGSHTLYRPDLDEHYHSVYGAIEESMHIYIHCGLNIIRKPGVRIFEVGFGTGLNAILSIIEAEKTDRILRYHTIEKYPLDRSLIHKLNYNQYLDPKYHEVFYSLHDAEWDQSRNIGKTSFLKIRGDIADYKPEENYDLIYFDPFSPEKEPELWSHGIFEKIYKSLIRGGYLVTYSVKGDIRRLLTDLGFHVERLPGPSGKKHILRAGK